MLWKLGITVAVVICIKSKINSTKLTANQFVSVTSNFLFSFFRQSIIA